MRTKLFVAAMAIMGVTSAFAVNDITPSRYVFANQEIGQYAINYVVGGANPENGWAVPADSFNNGFVTLHGAKAVYFTGALDVTTNANAYYFQQGVNIVNLGGTVGKVLCIRGTNSTLNYGTAIPDTWTSNWGGLNFYLDKTNSPIAGQADSVIRVRIVYNLYHNNPSVGTTIINKHYSSSNLNDAPDNNTSSAIGTEVSNFYTEDDDENLSYDITKWVAREFDFVIGTAEGSPARLKMELGMDNLKNGTIFIKEISFTTQNTGEATEQAMETYEVETSSLNTAKYETLSVSVLGNELSLYNVAEGTLVRVYAATGKQVASVSYQGQSINLQNGMYIVKAGSKVAKVIVK